MGADPDWFIQKKLAKTAQGLAFFGKEALAEYMRCFRNPETIHAICEDYRATSRHRSRDGHQGFRRRPQDQLPGAASSGARPVASAAITRAGRGLAALCRRHPRRQGAALRALPVGGGAGGNLSGAARRSFWRNEPWYACVTTPRSAPARARKFLHRVPQQVPVLAVARAVRGLRQDDELAVAVRQLPVEIQQVLVGRVAVPDRRAASAPATSTFFGSTIGRFDRHVEIGAGRDRVAELHFRRDDRLGHRRIVVLGDGRRG